MPRKENTSFKYLAWVCYLEALLKQEMKGKAIL